MVEFILAELFTPGKVWLGIFIGILVAAGIYFLLPDNDIKNALAIGAIVTGFLVGLILSANTDKT